MTYPDGRPIMLAVAGNAGRAPFSLVIDEAYLRRFGELLVPVNLWRALSRFDAWIEPAIVAEWIRLMHGYAHRTGTDAKRCQDCAAMQWSRAGTHRRRGAGNARSQLSNRGGRSCACGPGAA
jgi:hypothetical protein